MLFNHIKSLAKHTAVYGLGDILGRAVSVLLLPLYARLLTTEDNGVMALAFVFIGFSAVFYSLGLNQALIRFLSGGGDTEAGRNRFSTAFYTLLGTGLALSTLTWLYSPVLAVAFLESASYTDIFHLVAAIVLLDTVAEPLFTLCRARQRSAAYASVRLVQHTLQLGLTIYLIAGLGHGVRAIFWSNVASSAFALVALLPVGIRALRPTWSAEALRELLTFGLPFVPSALAMLVISLADRVLIKLFLGIDQVGVFTVVYRICLPMQVLVRVFRFAWAPAVLDIASPQEARGVVARVTTYFTMSAVFFFLFVSAFARELILLVAGGNAQHYLPAQHIVPPVTLAFVLSGLYIILTAGVYVEGRSRLLPAVVGAGAAVNLGVNFLLIPRLGLVGAAWSTLAAYALMVLLLHLYTRSFYPVAHEYARLAKIAVAGAVIFTVVSSYANETTPSGIATRAIFLLGYPLILWGWRFFDPREWQDFRSLVRFSRHRAQG